MNLYEVFAKLSLDTGDYEKNIKSAQKDGTSFSQTLKSGLSKAGQIAAKGIGLVTGAAVAAGGALLAVEEATEEYRIAQGKLNTAFEAAGYSAEDAQKTYEEFYKILGDTDTATEASQLLAKLSDSTEDLSKWTNIAAGVSGTFGDSLPIEGLIEASNETAKVGTVTGVLADALNWAGISEDEFNEKLADCTDESERNNLIMETLSTTYEDASGIFYENNAAVVEMRENQALLDETMASLGETVAIVKNGFIEEFLPAILEVTSAFSGMLSGVEGSDEQFSEAIGSLIQTFVEKLPEFLQIGVEILTAIINGIIQSLPSLIAAVPQIIMSIWTALTELMPQVLQMGVEIIGQIADGIETGLPDFVASLPTIISEFLAYMTSQMPTILQQGVEIINSIINGIVESIPEFVAALPDIITSFTSFFEENGPQIIDAGMGVIKNLVVGLIKAIPDIIASLPSIVIAIVRGFLSFSSTFAEIGKNIIKGVWEGISGSFSWLYRQVKNFFGGIVDGVMRFLKINSPSKVFANIGAGMAEGVGVGWEDEYDSIKKDIESGLNFSSKISVKKSNNGKDDNSTLADILSQVNNKLDMGIYLDGKTLVGKLSSTIDSSLGGIRTAKARGVV